MQGRSDKSGKAASVKGYGREGSEGAGTGVGGRTPVNTIVAEESAGQGPGRLGRICGGYSQLPRRPPVWTTLVPVTFWLPREVVSSPASFVS